MNRVLAHTGARYPIVQAPMGWIARSPLARRVCNAGGLGIIETSSGETANCQAEILKMRDLTTAPFGVNLPILFLKDDAMVRFICDSGRQVRHHLGGIAGEVPRRRSRPPGSSSITRCRRSRRR